MEREMEELEKRNKRFKSMHMEATNVEFSGAQSASLPPGYLFNPLIQPSRTLSSTYLYSTPFSRFDYYLDPMSVFSGNKGRGNGTYHNPPYNFSSPIHSSWPIASSPSSFPGPWKTPVSSIPTPLNQFQVNCYSNHGSYGVQLPIPHSAPWSSPASPGTPLSAPLPTPRSVPPWLGPASPGNPFSAHGPVRAPVVFYRGPFGHGFPQNATLRGGFTKPVNIGGSPTINPGGGSSMTNLGRGSSTANPGQGSTATNLGRGSSMTNLGRGSSTTNPGQGSSMTNLGRGSSTTDLVSGSPTTDPGRGGPMTNPGGGSSTTNRGSGSSTANPGGGISTTNLGRGSSTTNLGRGSSVTNLGRGSQITSSGRGKKSRVGGKKGLCDNVSACEQPQMFYRKQMVNDPWSRLEPVVGNILVPLTCPTKPDSLISWLPKSIAVKKAKVDETTKGFQSQLSLADYLAQAFEEAANETTESSEVDSNTHC